MFPNSNLVSGLEKSICNFFKERLQKNTQFQLSALCDAIACHRLVATLTSQVLAPPSGVDLCLERGRSSKASVYAGK